MGQRQICFPKIAEGGFLRITGCKCFVSDAERLPVQRRVSNQKNTVRGGKDSNHEELSRNDEESLSYVEAQEGGRHGPRLKLSPTAAAAHAVTGCHFQLNQENIANIDWEASEVAGFLALIEEHLPSAVTQSYMVV